MFRNTLKALGLCAALGLASPLHAQETMQVRVSVDDLNLRTEAGTDVVLRRLSRAAAKICGVDHSRDLSRLAAAEKCSLGLNATVERTGEAGPLLDLSESLRKSASAAP